MKKRQVNPTFFILKKLLKSADKSYFFINLYLVIEVKFYLLDIVLQNFYPLYIIISTKCV